MHNTYSFLSEWFIEFLKYKDSTKKELVSIEKRDKQNFSLHFKTRIIYCVVAPELDLEIFNLFDLNKDQFIVVLNNQNNVDFVARRWDKLVRFHSLKIYLVNPFSNPEKFWILSPNAHNKICDDSSLLVGLKSLAEAVTPINLKEFEFKIKTSEEEAAR
jgi:hypothetical protein